MYRAVLTFSDDVPWVTLIATVPMLQTNSPSSATSSPRWMPAAKAKPPAPSKAKAPPSTKRPGAKTSASPSSPSPAPLYAVGAANNDNEMTAVANITPSLLKGLRDDLLGSRATSIHALASANAAALVPALVPAGRHRYSSHRSQQSQNRLERQHPASPPAPSRRHRPLREP